MAKPSDLFLTGLAPAIWGSTYIVTTQWLPPGYPLTVSLLRALPAGIILLLVVRRLPQARWLPKLFVLGFLNFTLFWTLLFVAAYRLPGGVAATLGAIQPLIVLFLARGLIGTPVKPLAVAAAIAGLAGVGLLLISSRIALDPLGVAAALGGALSMAFGTVLTRKWQWPVSPLTLTAWQLTAGGLLLAPIALLAEPAFPMPDMKNLAGLLWLGLIGAAATYALWFRGIARIGPGNAALLGFLSPLSAVVLGWLILGEALTPIQLAGALLVMASLWTGQRAGRAAPGAFGKSSTETKTPAE